ncbi:hypothetical protein SAMN05216410_2699 [Sanguibacter gelidistatuariae]|uniref:Uncharacterized protein n=1 Tax=Sanguibacter gelidistatuariae TaxID=1814289 RepID=A0A1G6RIP6_9MICO|nr:hypothetical protein [Sanguibacter gelidistatuariae]SDD04428.1 hypothetical protein SAMN05216410_2699 [Sanguibacter gelidistatuariae]
MSDAWTVVVETEHVRRSFGMLTAYVLAPEANAELLTEFAHLSLEEQVSLLAATRSLWHAFAGEAAALGGYSGSVATALRHTRTLTAGRYLDTLPAAVDVAHRVDDALSLPGAASLDARLAAELGEHPTHALGALGYFLGATSSALGVCAAQQKCSAATLLAAIGQQLALSD